MIINVNKSLKQEAEKNKTGTMKEYIHGLIRAEWENRENNDPVSYPIESRPNYLQHRTTVLVDEQEYRMAEEMAHQDYRSIGSFINWLLAVDINKNRINQTKKHKL